MTEAELFVGRERSENLERLVAAYQRCAAEDARPAMELLAAPIGWGKTRLVRELYKALAGWQPEPAYWPPDLLIAAADSSRDPMLSRKVTRPPRFIVPASAQITFLWWGLNCDRRSDGVPVQALHAGADQLVAHSLAIEALGNSKLRSALRAGRLDTLDEVYSSGSAVLAVIGALGVAFPPLAWGQAAFDTAKRAVEHYRRVQEVFRRRRLAASERAVPGADEQSTDSAIELANGLLKLSKILPIVIAIEDVHHADCALLAFTSHLLEANAGRILIVGTTWPDMIDAGGARGGFAAWWPAECERSPARIRRMDLPALTDGDLRRLLQAYAPNTSESTVRSFVERFSPNPLALLQSLTFRTVRKALREGAIELAPEEIRELPTDLRDQYKRKWNELPKDVREVLLTAAFLGPRFVDGVTATSAGHIGVTDPRTSLERTIVPYAWTRRIDEDLRAFIEHDMYGLVADLVPRELGAAELRDIAAIVGRFTHGALDPGRNPLSPLARECLLATFVRLSTAKYLEPSPDQLGEVAIDLAEIWQSYGRLSDAVELLENVIEEVGKDPAAWWPSIVLIDLLRITERSEDAFPRAHQLAVRLDGTPEQRIHLALVLADLLADTGCYADAEQAVRQVGSDLALDSASTLRRDAVLARVVAERGRFEEARDIAWTSLERAEAADVSEADRLVLQSQLSWYLSRSGNNGSALSIARAVHDRLRVVLGNDHVETLAARNNVARFLDRSGDSSGAAALGTEVIRELENALGATHVLTLLALGNLVRYLGRTGDRAEALRRAHELSARWECRGGGSHPKALDARLDLLRASGHAGRLDGLAASGQSLLMRYDEILGPGHPNTIRARCDVAELLAGVDRHAAVAVILDARASTTSMIATAPESTDVRRVSQLLGLEGHG